MPPLKDTLHAKSQMVATGKDTAEKTRNQRFFTLPHFFSGRIPHPKRYGNTAGHGHGCYNGTSLSPVAESVG